jgi:hypothetical protein
MTKRYIVLGTTDPEDFELTNVEGDDLDVELEISKRTGPGPTDLADVEDPPEADWLDQAARTVRVTGLEKLVLGSYQVRYKVSQGASFGYVPDGEHSDLWIVVPVGNR